MTPNFDEYVGLPYKATGRARSGIDCYGLLVLIYRERLDISLPLYEGYDDPHEARALELLRQGKSSWVQVAKPNTYDAVLFKVHGAPNHIGLVTKPGTMIHCARGKDSVIEGYLRPMWKSRIEGFYRHA